MKSTRKVITWLTVMSLTVMIYFPFFSPARLQPQTAEAVLVPALNNYRPKDHAIVRKDGLWHVYAIYVCIDQTPPCDTTPMGLMHLTSTDLTNWTEVGYVIPPGTSGAWDDYDIWAPSIVEKDGTYYMFYTGVTNATNLVQKIGVATSTDLYNWTKHPSNPVLNCDNFSWAHYNEAEAFGAACRDPYLVWDETEQQWVMFMSARQTADTPTTNAPVIGIATSEDLLTWREYDFISTTIDNTAESPHLLQNGGTNYLVFTDNCSPQPCLKYVSSTNLYSGYGSQASTGLENNAFASDYYKDFNGRQYFTRIDGTTNQKFDFDELIWTGSPFTVQEPSYATIGDYLWNDADGDGVQDAGEVGIDNVTVQLYTDNGDGLFDAAADDLYASAVTGDDPNTGGTQHGYYAFTTVLPGYTYWLTVDPNEYASGGQLHHFVNTTDNAAVTISPTDNQSLITHDLGFQAEGTSWPLSTTANFTVGSGLTLTGGRAAPTALSPTPSWWNTDYRYRKQVTVTAVTEALTTDNTMVLSENLTTLVSAGKLQADYDDLRLIYWNGSSNTEIDLDIIDSNTQRFKLQAAVSAGNTNTNYYLYYGNPSANPEGVEFAKVYEYYESFNNPNAATYSTWNENGDLNWKIDDNKWRYDNVIAGDRYTVDTGTTIDLSADWATEVTVTINSGAVGGISLVRIDNFNEDKYWWNLDAANDRTQVFRWLVGQVGANVSTTLDTGTAYTTRFEYQYVHSDSHTMIGYINDTLNQSRAEGGSGYDIWYSATYPGNLKSAHFGLNTFNGNVSFNHYKAWQLHDGTAVAGSEVNRRPVVADTIQPKTNQAITFGKLTSFSASGLAQNGSVQYVLSNDSGATWLYWNGSSWAASDSSLLQSNTASQIDANASGFPYGSGQLLWKAVLDSTGNGLPTLLQVGASVNQRATTPSIVSPSSGSSTFDQSPSFQILSTDPETESIQYQLQIDTVGTFDSPNLQTFTQSSSQTGWSGQDADGGTAYASGTTATFTPTTELTFDTYYWRMRGLDSGSGVYSDYSTAGLLSIVKEYKLRTPTLVSPADHQVLFESKPLFTGLAESGNTIFLILDGVIEATFKATEHSSGVGSFAYRSKRHLSPGQHSFHLIARDDATGGISRTSKLYRFTTFPNVGPTILRPAAGQSLSSQTITIAGVAWRNHDVFIFVDGALTSVVKATEHVSGVGEFNRRLSLDEGTHTIHARTRGPDGSISPASRIVTVTIKDSSLPYVVKAGDSLWSIAKEFLGLGSRYPELIETNKATYPALVTSSVIFIGQLLRILL